MSCCQRWPVWLTWPDAQTASCLLLLPLQETNNGYKVWCSSAAGVFQKLCMPKQHLTYLARCSNSKLPSVAAATGNTQTDAAACLNLAEQWRRGMMKCCSTNSLLVMHDKQGKVTAKHVHGNPQLLHSTLSTQCAAAAAASSLMMYGENKVVHSVTCAEELQLVL